MNQIMSWICLISIWFLSLQVMIYICESTLKLFNSVNNSNKNRSKNVVISNTSYSYKNKIAK